MNEIKVMEDHRRRVLELDALARALMTCTDGRPAGFGRQDVGRERVQETTHRTAQ